MPKTTPSSAFKVRELKYDGVFWVSTVYVVVVDQYGLATKCLKGGHLTRFKALRDMARDRREAHLKLLLWKLKQ